MVAYVIYQAEVTDPEPYALYREKSAPAVLDAGGEFIVRGGDVDVLEGDPPLGRTVIVKFDSMESARKWYDSQAYTEARALREGAANANMYIVDGID